MVEYGVVTRNADDAERPEFDRAFFEVKDVTGRSEEPVPGAVNMVSCFGDNAAAADDPGLVPVTPEGEEATRERTYFDWSYVCPTHEAYRDGLLEIIDDCADAKDDVRLDDVGFPRPEYCYCDRCNREFAAWAEDRHDRGEGPHPEETTAADRFAWRAAVITEFVEEAVEHVLGRTYFTLYPDPYGDHLYERAGLDLQALEPLVDEFVVPLYDTFYGTTYWLEVIASGFCDRLATPISVEIYAVDVEIDNLVHAAEVASEYGEAVLFGYDSSNAVAALRRMDAESRDGVSFG
jgi:hypothetical protein